MRLTCPNCGAQYAVDDRVIPSAGRDVQCSNCGNTWFQQRADAQREQDVVPTPQPAPAPQPTPSVEPTPQPAPTPQPEPSVEPTPQSRPRSEPTPEPEPEPEASPEPQAAPIPDPEPETEEGPIPEAPSVSVEDEVSHAADDEEPEPEPALAAPEPEPEPEPEATEEPEEPPEPPAQQRLPVDEAVMSILREEAELEQAARRKSAEGLETQGELNIDVPGSDAPPSAPGTPMRDPARVVPTDVMPTEAGRTDGLGSRGDLLPDVEEINSTLRPDETVTAPVMAARYTDERRGRGRRIGLGVAFLIFGTLALVYAQAGRVAQAVPEATPALESYVATVNSARVWLDQTLRDAVDTVQGTDG